MTFTVIGEPAAKGSKTAFVRNRCAVMVDGGPSKTSRARYAAWKLAVTAAASSLGLARQPDPLDGPVAISVAFYLPRPKSHSRARRAVAWHTSKPDTDKLLRAVLDPLTGILVRDDSQFAIAHAEKRYAVSPDRVGAVITITQLPEERAI